MIEWLCFPCSTRRLWQETSCLLEFVAILDCTNRFDGYNILIIFESIFIEVKFHCYLFPYSKAKWFNLLHLIHIPWIDKLGASTAIDMSVQ